MKFIIIYKPVLFIYLLGPISSYHDEMAEPRRNVETW